MKTVKIDIDGRKYEIFKNAWITKNPENELIEDLKDIVRVHNEPRRPCLKIAGTERKQTSKTENAAKNVVSMGIAPRKTEITLKIDDSLYGELEKMSREKGFGTADELVRKEVTLFIDVTYDMSQPDRTCMWLAEAILGPKKHIQLVK
jgi:hypothetical protein